jgi:predicted Ser/Thr protein kinase
MSAPTAPTRAETESHAIGVLHRGGARNPDVLLVELEGRRVVVKDFAARPRWIRETLGRWLTRREARAYRVLDGLACVPRWLGQVDALALAVEYRPGRRMSRRLAGELPRGFIDRLDEAISSLHERGVVHLDLRHRSNVLVDARGEPVLIDFASAILLRPDGWLGRALLPWLARVDRRALAKWRQRLVPESAPPSPRGASRPT